MSIVGFCQTVRMSKTIIAIEVTQVLLLLTTFTT